MPNNLLSIGLLAIGLVGADGLTSPTPKQHVKTQTQTQTQTQAVPSSRRRRAFLSTTSASAATAFFTSILSQPQIANARYVLNDETGEYDEVQDKDWQTTWGERLDKAKSMGTEDVFLAAQGAGNAELRQGEESEASKKRRALAGCRNDGFRSKSVGGGVKECTARVLGGDYQFMVDAMN